MNRLIFIPAVMLIVFNASAQSMRAETLRLLKARKFSTMDYFMDSPDGRRISWPAQRDLLPGYREAVWAGEQLIIDKKNPDIIHDYLYHATLLIKDDKIIAYKFSERKFRKHTLEVYYATVHEFKDSKAYNTLKADFNRFYDQPLKEDDLFETSFVYGDQCTMLKTIPEGRKQLHEWIAGKNKMALMSWLKSANTEKQVYALEGILQLQKEDSITLTEAEQKIMKYVKGKQGTMSVCDGSTDLVHMYIPDIIQALDERFKR